MNSFLIIHFYLSPQSQTIRFYEKNFCLGKTFHCFTAWARLAESFPKSLPCACRSMTLLRQCALVRGTRTLIWVFLIKYDKIKRFYYLPSQFFPRISMFRQHGSRQRSHSSTEALSIIIFQKWNFLSPNCFSRAFIVRQGRTGKKRRTIFAFDTRKMPNNPNNTK